MSHRPSRLITLALSPFVFSLLLACVPPESEGMAVVPGGDASSVAAASGLEAAEGPAKASATNPANPLAAASTGDGGDGSGDGLSDSIPEAERDDGSDKLADPNKAPPSDEFKDMRKAGGDAPGAGPGKDDGREWVSVGVAKLGAALKVSADVAGGKGTALADDSPLRVFLGPLVDSPLEGYVLFLGADDKTVLMGQSSKPGIYDKELYRSKSASPRTKAGVVTLEVPSSALPKKDLKAWAGGGGGMSIGGVELPAASDTTIEQPNDPEAKEPDTYQPPPTPVEPKKIKFVTIKS